jgi:zinc transport system ATP-binding protein
LSTKIKIKNCPQDDLKKVLILVNLSEKLLKEPLVLLSVGQFQRATIAFALIDRPTVLLLDEPTSGVDLPGEERVYDIIHRLQKTENLSVIIVSHDLSLVYRYANKVLCLNRQMICFGEPQEVLTPEQLQKIYGERVIYEHRHG